MARIFLAMNGKKINTLDDLRANFNGKQILDFFRAGRLQKWLEEQQENDLLETVQDFQKENYDDETLLSMLMAAFELDENIVAEQISTQKLEKEKQLAEKKLAAEPQKPVKEENLPPQEPEAEYTPEERAILRIRNKFLSVMRVALGDDLLDYEKHLDTNFTDFGISEDLQNKLKEKLAVEFKFYPVKYESEVYQYENGLEYISESPFTILCSILKKYGPECFRSVDIWHSYEWSDVTFGSNIKYPNKYKNLLLTGKKQKKKNFGTLEEWSAKGDNLSGNMGKFVASLKPALPEYESADVKASAELKYFRQKAALALLEDHFKISSDSKTRNQTIILETDLKKQCGFDDKKIREFNDRIQLLFPDHEKCSKSNEIAMTGVLQAQMIGGMLNGELSGETTGINTTLGMVNQLAGGLLKGDLSEATMGMSKNITSELICWTFYEYEPVTHEILNASIEDIFRFCKCW